MRHENTSLLSGAADQTNQFQKGRIVNVHKAGTQIRPAKMRIINVTSRSLVLASEREPPMGKVEIEVGGFRIVGHVSSFVHVLDECVVLVHITAFQQLAGDPTPPETEEQRRSALTARVWTWALATAATLGRLTKRRGLQFAMGCKRRNAACVAAYVDDLRRRIAALSIKQHLAGVRIPFHWPAAQAIAIEPAHVVRSARHSVQKGNASELSAEPMRRFLGFD